LKLVVLVDVQHPDQTLIAVFPLMETFVPDKPPSVVFRALTVGSTSYGVAGTTGGSLLTKSCSTS
jgi:hypothetical protein